MPDHSTHPDLGPGVPSRAISARGLRLARVQVLDNCAGSNLMSDLDLAEHRLLLRADNADECLAEAGHALGLLTAAQIGQVRTKYQAIEAERRRLERVLVTLPAGTDDGSPGRPASAVRAIDLLARPDGSWARLDALGAGDGLRPEWREALEVRVKYRGYIERQQRAAGAARSLEDMALADALWDGGLNGLSNEALEKLCRWRPATVGQASRIAGVSPADVAVLLVHAKRFAART